MCAKCRQTVIIVVKMWQKIIVKIPIGKYNIKHK